MRYPRIVSVVPLLLMVLVLVAACSSPTPTPTPQPATPTPGPTLEPTATATPTATPTPTIQEAIEQARPAVVRMSSGSRTWNGVMIANGIILTTSRNLGSAPIADYRTEAGANGQAWVIGRDDDLDLALLQVVNAPGDFPSIQVARVPMPSVDQDAVLLQFGPGGTTVEPRTARVIGVREDLSTAFRYIQIQAPTGSSGDGALLMDTAGRFIGLRMSEQQMTRLGIGRAGEVYGIAVDALLDRVIPVLENGVVVIRSPEDEGGSGGVVPPPPPLPAIFRGELTSGGQPIAAGARLYARLSKAGLPDLWFTHQITAAGRYNLATGVLTGGYEGATVEFWYDAKKAAQNATYQPGGNSVANLTFN